MIDFSKVKFDEDRKPFIVERGEGGRFERRYLNDAEQQAHKEWSAACANERNSAAVAPAPACGRSDARTSSFRSCYESQPGPTGPVGPGPCPSGISGTPGLRGIPNDVFIPVPLTEPFEDVSVGQRVARRSVTLMDSMTRLSAALYAFGAIDDDAVGSLRAYITQRHSGPFDSDEGLYAENQLVPPDDYIRSMAGLLYESYNTERSQAPLKVVGLHAAPVITVAQYLMGLIFPDGHMALTAQRGELLHRVDSPIHELVIGITEVYNLIQADISEAGIRLLGEIPEEIGEVVTSMSELPVLDTVRAVDEMISYLVTRMDTLTSMLTDQL